MTNSNDTATPAMSAETVPSEEFVLVPREPTPAMQRAYFDSIDANMHRVENDVRFGRYENMRTAYRAMIAAAPTLSASHLAKEGGEAGAVEIFGPYGWLVKPIGLAEDEWSLESDPAGDEEHAVSVALYALEPQKLGVTVPISGNLEKSLSIDWHSVFEDIGLARDLIKEAKKTGGDEAADNLDAAEHWLDQVEKALSPQPSPALAKGGAAVRLLPCPFCGGKPTLHPHSPDHSLGAWVSCSTCGLESPTETGQSVEAAVQHWNTRAALSTPTEGPVSQTEGMGGDEGIDPIDAELQEIQDGAWGDGPAKRGWARDEIARRAARRAALTPPETAEAVPVAPATEIKAWLIGDPATGQWIEVDGQRVEHSRGMGTPVVALAEAFKSERARADAAVRERNIARSERDDTVKALEEAALWHDGQDKAISKQPNANVGHNGWMRNEHQGQARTLRAAARSAPREGASDE